MIAKFSYDYELAWGTYEMVGPEYLDSNVRQSNAAAARMFDAHEQAGVGADWGLVGAALSRSNLDERLADCDALGAPVALLRSYLDSADEVDNLTTIPDTFIDSLRASSIQSAACHTYSHRYAPDATAEQLRSDMQLCLATFESVGLAPAELLIAPKNLVTSELQQAAESVGVHEIRHNPDNFLYRTGAWGEGSVLAAKAIRYGRYADAYLPISELVNATSRSAPSASCEGNFFLRPNLRRGAAELHYRRLQVWLSSCRRTGRTPHIWCHPHNFAPDTDQAVAFLQRVLNLVSKELKYE